jgi:hypothetical protein
MCAAVAAAFSFADQVLSVMSFWKLSFSPAGCIEGNFREVYDTDGLAAGRKHSFSPPACPALGCVVYR